MTGIADRIMKRVRAKGRGRWVCTPKDFLDLGSRPAVDLQAVDRFIKQHSETEAKPFTRRADPDQIIAAGNRGFQMSEAIH